MRTLNRLVAPEALFPYIRLTIGIVFGVSGSKFEGSRMIREASIEDRREERNRERWSRRRETETEKEARGWAKRGREKFNSGAKHMQIHSSIPRQWDLCDGTIAAILV